MLFVLFVKNSVYSRGHFFHCISYLDMSVCPVFGVDLGTTNSASGIMRNGKVDMVADKNGSKTVPSYVAYPPNGNPAYIVGKIARDRMRSNPAGVIFDCKRLIGMQYTDPIVEKMKEYVPFEIIDGGDNKPVVRVVQKGENIDKRPEEIGASILSYLQKLTSEFAGFDIRKAVITVPAYFDQCQRQATKDAGVIAGLDVVAIIPEPVAAAYAYADQNMQSNEEKTVMIYDLGGGTFDVTVMSVHGLKYKVLGLNGDLFLGGSDFDTLIMNEVYKAYLADDNEELNQRKRSKLRFQCEEAKMTLKTVPECEIVIDDWTYVLTQTKLAVLLKPMIQKTIDLCKSTLKACGRTIEDISDIILVGGSSRLAIVYEMLQKEFHKKLKETVNPDECVAYGATKYGYFMTQSLDMDIDDSVGMGKKSPKEPVAPSVPVLPPQPPVLPPQPPVLPPQPLVISPSVVSPSQSLYESKELNMNDIPDITVMPNDPIIRPVVDITCPSDIGINVNKRLKVIIPQGQLLPFEGYTTFSNAESWAISVSVDIYQGTHKHVSHDRKLKTITVNNIQPRPKGKNIFIIFMKMDKMGSLSVRVADFDTGADTVCEAIETNLSSKDIADMRRKLEDEERAQEQYMRFINHYQAIQKRIAGLIMSTTDPEEKRRLQQIETQMQPIKTEQELQVLESQI